MSRFLLLTACAGDGPVLIAIDKIDWIVVGSGDGGTHIGLNGDNTEYCHVRESVADIADALGDEVVRVPTKEESK
jgi:hypothetical protein